MGYSVMRTYLRIIDYIDIDKIKELKLRDNNMYIWDGCGTDLKIKEAYLDNKCCFEIYLNVPQFGGFNEWILQHTVTTEDDLITVLRSFKGPFKN